MQMVVSQDNSTLSAQWGKIYHELESQIPSQFFTAFFSDVKATFEGDNVIILKSKDTKVLNHIKKCYRSVIENVAKTICQKKIHISFKKVEVSDDSNVNRKHPAQELQKLRKNSDKSKPAGLEINQSAYPNKISVNPNYVFERFVRGPSNEHALAAAQGCAFNQDNFSNPLYLYGGVGRGKTHLMMAIGNYIAQHYPWLKVEYSPSEILQSDLVEAFKTNSIPHFNAKYRNVDVLLIDDIQFISQNAVQTQEAIFNTFNYLYQNGKKIVISGDTAPQNLSALTDRLKSRFQSGLIIEIKEPNFETRIAILKAKSEELKLSIPFDVLKYIASSMPKQIRVLEAALIKLRFFSDIENRPIDKQMAKIALKDLVSETGSQEVSVDDILRVVALKFHIPENDIIGTSRSSSVVLARHICMYLTRKLIPRKSLAIIASDFGRSDHTTVLNAEKKVREYIDKDHSVKLQIDEILEELNF